MAEAFTKAAMQKSRGGEETRTKKKDGGLETLKPYPTMNRWELQKEGGFRKQVCVEKKFFKKRGRNSLKFTKKKRDWNEERNKDVSGWQ